MPLSVTKATPIEGLAAIKRWKAATKSKYHHTVTPLDAAQREGKTVVIGNSPATFPAAL